MLRKDREPKFGWKAYWLNLLEVVGDLHASSRPVGGVDSVLGLLGTRRELDKCPLCELSSEYTLGGGGEDALGVVVPHEALQILVEFVVDKVAKRLAASVVDELDGPRGVRRGEHHLHLMVLAESKDVSEKDQSQKRGKRGQTDRREGIRIVMARSTVLEKQKARVGLATVLVLLPGRLYVREDLLLHHLLLELSVDPRLPLPENENVGKILVLSQLFLLDFALALEDQDDG